MTTKAALRTAKRVARQIKMMDVETAKKIATIIDEETGLPELLEVLERSADYLDEIDTWAREDTLKCARSALAKAKGETS